VAVGTFVRPDLFWSTDRVAELLRTAPKGGTDTSLSVVDCRFGVEGGAHAAYLAGHLPGAVHCDWSKDLVAPPPPSGHPASLLPGPIEFAATMTRLGITNRTLVIGYDAEGGHHAARLWLALRYYGHDRCGVMEGGIQKWVAEGRPLETGEVGRPGVLVAPRLTFIARPRDGVVATKEEVLAAVRTGDPWLLDVRRETEYTGEEARAARGGHIPGAVNMLWRDALNEDWTLRDPDELEETFINAGFGPETSTITYCQAGVRASFTHLLLTALGHPDVRTYAGSWDEWGNDPSLPVVKGRS